MQDKNTALNQIKDIHAVLQNNLQAVLSGSLMMATGFGIAAIPLLEMIFEYGLDPLLIGRLCMPVWVIFLLRTAFYWAFFNGISKYFDLRDRKNPLLEKAFRGIGVVFPFIAVSVAADLAIAGYSNLIAPLMLLLIGCLFLFFGQFAQLIVRLIAYNLIIASLIGIWLTTCNIPHLWEYLVCYEGLSFIIMGIVLKRSKQQDFAE